MIRMHSALANSLTRHGSAGVLTLAAMLLATACSDGGIAEPSPSAAKLPTLDAAIVRDTSAASVVTGGIRTGLLTNGGNHSGAIAVAAQTDIWTFNATAGQFLVVAIGQISESSEFIPWIRLVNPSGVIIANSFGAEAAQISIAAPLTGTYTVVAATNDPGFNGTGTYRLMAAQLQGSLIVSPGDQGGPITNGANNTGNHSVGDLDLWSFSATLGDAITIAIGEVAGVADYTPWFRLIAPNGQQIGNFSGAAAAQMQLLAPSTGTYTIIVGTNDAGLDATGVYMLTLAKAPGAIVISPGDQGGPLTAGLNHTGTIPVGDLDTWTFTATQGELLVLAIGETSGSANFTPWIRLFTPNGGLIGNDWGAAATQIAVNATSTGTYLVVVSTNDAGFDDSGTYTLTMAQGNTAPSISPGDQGGSLTNGANHAGAISIGDLDIFTFTATQGDGLVLAVGEGVSATDFTPWIRLISPSGALLASSSSAAAAQLAVSAASTGTYQVVITTNDAGNDATGNYNLTLARGPGTFTISPGDQGGAATNGGNDLGTIHVGDLDVYSFNTVQGLPFAVNIGEVTGSVDFTPWIRVIAPNGAFLGNAFGAAAAQVSAIAPLTGQYTIVVSTNDGGNDDTGTYRLVVQKSGPFVTPPGDEGGVITNGAIHTGTIVTGDLDRWTIAANPNETIVISVGEVTGNDFTPWVRLVSPSGILLVNASSTVVTQITVTTAETGNYTLAVGSIDPGFDGTGTYTLTVAKAPGSFIVSPGDQGGAISNGVQNGSIVVGDIDMWSVTATQGSPLQLTMTEVSGTTDFRVWIRLVAPNGTMIGNSNGGTTATVNVSAPSTGTYTIILGTADSGNDATGSYTLSVAGVNMVPRPNMVPVVGQLNAFMSPRATSYGPDGTR